MGSHLSSSCLVDINIRAVSKSPALGEYYFQGGKETAECSGSQCYQLSRASLVSVTESGPRHQQVLFGKHPSEPDTGVIRVEGEKGTEWLSRRAHYTVQLLSEKGRAEQSLLCHSGHGEGLKTVQDPPCSSSAETVVSEKSR